MATWLASKSNYDSKLGNSKIKLRYYCQIVIRITGENQFDGSNEMFWLQLIMFGISYKSNMNLYELYYVCTTCMCVMNYTNINRVED